MGHLGRGGIGQRGVELGVEMGSGAVGQRSWLETGTASSGDCQPYLCRWTRDADRAAGLEG